MKNFDRDGLGFLLSYARKTKGQPFSSEEVTSAAQQAGIVPDELRSWGKHFANAARQGYISRCDTPFRRALGNGTLTLGWVAV
jgi:hypothetical protein